ncbi:MAG: hypothetical protein ACRDJN_28565, partial [Chloroflexota bacterium]
MKADRGSWLWPWTNDDDLSQLETVELKTEPVRRSGRLEEWLRPLEPSDDTSGWETHPMPEDQPRGPRGSIFAVDHDAEQTACRYDRSEA